MEKLTFPSSDFNPLIVDKLGDPNRPRVLAHDMAGEVEVGLTFRPSGTSTALILNTFHNRSNKKGMARCALLKLLLKLRDDKYVEDDTFIYVSSPTPTERIITLYQGIGFNLTSIDEQELNFGFTITGEKHYMLNSTVGNIISVLETQCDFVLGGGGRKTKQKIYKRKKRTKRKKKTKRKKRNKRR